MKNSCGKDIGKLAEEITKFKEEAKKLGIFTDDRNLIECLECGLMEDVDVYGKLFTVFRESPYKKTVFQFIELNENYYQCPNCSMKIKAENL